MSRNRPTGTSRAMLLFSQFSKQRISFTGSGTRVSNLVPFILLTPITAQLSSLRKWCYRITFKRNLEKTTQGNAFVNKLTTSISEGMRDKKSISSLLSTAFGLRIFFVNLFIPIRQQTRVTSEQDFAHHKSRNRQRFTRRKMMSCR